MPLAGAGISASTLSVEISKSGSSRWTLSPTFLSHLVMVPSKMDSPIWGMTTSVAGPAVGADFLESDNAVLPAAGVEGTAGFFVSGNAAAPLPVADAWAGNAALPVADAWSSMTAT